MKYCLTVKQVTHDSFHSLKKKDAVIKKAECSINPYARFRFMQNMR